MYILRQVEKTFIRLLLIAILIPLQSCSNTLVGEKLENSFDIIETPTTLENTSKVKIQNKLNKTKKIKSSKKDDDLDKEKIQISTLQNKSLSNKDRLSQKSNRSSKKVIFNPQPYRIILKLSGANPSAPAETVTNALRKAGVQFEVEKIERYDDKSLLMDSSVKR